MRLTKTSLRAALLVALALAGCAVGPDYQSPTPAAPDAWTAANASAEPASTETLAAWWRSLNDPTLDALIDAAVRDNRTVRQALARVTESRARRGATRAAFLPSINGSAGASRSDVGTRSTSSIGQFDERDLYDAGLDSIWELDLFGAQRHTFEAATAQLQATEAELRDVLLTLLGDVALTYTNVRTTQMRLTFAERNLRAQEEVLQITEWRAQAGLVSVLDVEQARASFEQTRAQIPSLESALTQQLNRLAVLTGQTPGALTSQLADRKPAPAASLENVVGTPMEVLRRRPDIRAAERRIAAQTAQVGVATAAFYPSLSLSGAISWQAAAASDVLDGVRSERSGLSLTVPIFRGGALRQNLRIQNALLEQSVASYEATVLTAFEEVENALAAWSTEQRRHAALIDAVASARRAAELALVQYNAGLTDFQTVLTADRQLITLEDALAVSEGELTANLIRLYKALGGGWSVWP